MIGQARTRTATAERSIVRSKHRKAKGEPRGRWLLHDDPLWPATLARLRHDIYHRPEYVGAEARRIGGRPAAFHYAEGDAFWFVPDIARCAGHRGLGAEGGASDIVSPYGYPGPIASAGSAAPRFHERAFAAFLDGLRERGAVSAFLRNHPCLDALPPIEASPNLTERAWATVLIELDADLDTIWSGVSRRRRQQIAKAARTGMRARRIAFMDGLPWLERVYDETMERVDAAGHERLDGAYFRTLAPLAAHLDVWIIEQQGAPIAATLVSHHGGLVQTLVGGTRTAALAHSPDRLLIWELVAWGHATGVRAVHLGGGVGGRDDGVMRFKASFGAGRARFRTLRAVLDPHRYAELTEARAAALGVAVSDLEASGYFPAYRSEPPTPPADRCRSISERSRAPPGERVRSSHEQDDVKWSDR